MNPSARASIAYVAARVITGKDSGHIYDYSQTKYINIAGSVGGKSVSVFDYSRKCYFSGQLPSLYDYGQGAYVTININGSSFSGFNYRTKSHFTGTISGSNVSFYDYEVRQYFNYTL